MISSSFCLIVSQATSSPRGGLRAAAEEALEREDAARRLHPLVVHRPADGGDVDAHLVGDLLHLERLDVLRALVQEGPLVLDDGPRHLLQRVAALLDRFHQPLGRLNLALEVFLGLGVGALVAVQLDVAAADVDVRRPVVEQADVVIARPPSRSTAMSGTT